jgi:AraC-like DNA-binding protein
MRLAHVTSGDMPPLWPPLLATRGPGSQSARHIHHAMHLILALDGELKVEVNGKWKRAAGVLTASDVAHALDATGRQVLLVFLDPESASGAALQSTFAPPVRLLTGAERDGLRIDPLEVMLSGGVAWAQRAVTLLGGPALPAVRRVHPKVRKLLRHLQTIGPEAEVSLEALAQQVGLSPGRLMHAFTESIGIALRPYLAWRKLQRAAVAIASGESLGAAAQVAGFADSAHMTRTFRKMFGVTPSALRPTR